MVMLAMLSCSDRKENARRNSHTDISYASDTANIHHLLNEVRSLSPAHTDSTLLLLKGAVAKCIKIDYAEGESEALFLMAGVLYDQNKYREALELYEQVFNRAIKQNNHLLKARCLERMASVNLTTGDDHKALKQYYEALPFFEQYNYKEGIAKVFNIIGLYKNAQSKFDTAEIYLNKAILLNTEIGNKRGLIHNMGNLAYVYERSGRLEKAAEIYTSLIDSLKRLGDSVNLPMMLSNLASVNHKMKHMTEAVGHLRQAVALAQKTADTSMLAELYADFGELSVESQRIDSAEIFLNKSVFYASQIGDFRTQLSAMQMLLRSDTLRNDFKGASRRYKSIDWLNDTLYARKLRHSLRASELQYESEKKSQLIELQALTIQNAGKQKRFFLILLLLSGVTLVLLGLVIVLVVRNHRKKRELFEDSLKIRDLQIENSIKEDEINKLKIHKIEEEIRLKEREQLNSALALVQKNELLGVISSRISQAKSDSSKVEAGGLSDILSSIRLQLRGADDTDMFNQKFVKLHPEFFEKLKLQHPELTKSELKFCAYLRLNLTGNQIASIQHVTFEAIRKTRYRIRKKMGLLPGESLEDYISTF